MAKPGCSINETRVRESLLLHYVAFAGDVLCREMLLAVSVVNVNLASQEQYIHRGATPLLLAAGEGYDRCVELLLAVRADFEAADQRGTTPLHAAAQRRGSMTSLARTVVIILQHMPSKRQIRAALQEGGPLTEQQKGLPLLAAQIRGDRRWCEACLRLTRTSRRRKR